MYKSGLLCSHLSGIMGSLVPICQGSWDHLFPLVRDHGITCSHLSGIMGSLVPTCRGSWDHLFPLVQGSLDHFIPISQGLLCSLLFSFCFVSSVTLYCVCTAVCCTRIFLLVIAYCEYIHMKLNVNTMLLHTECISLLLLVSLWIWACFPEALGVQYVLWKLFVSTEVCTCVHTCVSHLVSPVWM